MTGALRARKADFVARRDLALMTAYFGGRMANADWRTMPLWQDWHASMTTPPRKPSNAQLISFFRALAAPSEAASAQS